MKIQKQILEELKEIAPTLSAIEKRNIYSVPENYFAKFNASMLKLVKPQTVIEELKSLSPELAKLEKRGVKGGPSGFFETFSAQMISKIQQDELAEVAPTLAQLQKANSLEAPAYFFEAFPQQMMKRMAIEQKAAEVPAVPAWVTKVNTAFEDLIAIFFRPKYTVAFAGIASMLVVGMMFFTEVEKQCSDLDCKMAALTTQEIDSYLKINDDFYNDEVFEINDSNTQQSIAVTADEAFAKALNSLSDEELSNAILD